jgi:Arc/MetJ-type ribon-helix-helix transcriptional regulator
MGLQKRTYSLPPELVERFERSVAAGRRSAVVSELVNDWLEQQQREELRADIIEGCHEMWDVYLEVEKEYHPLDEEVARKHADD